MALLGAALIVTVGYLAKPSDKSDAPSEAPPAPSATSTSVGATGPSASAQRVSSPPPVLRLATAHAEFGVLVKNVDFKSMSDRKKLAAQLGPALCGSPSLCDAARTVVADPSTMTFDRKPRKHWLLPTPAQLALQKPPVTAEDTEREQTLPDLFIISAEGAPTQDHRVARAAFAAAAVVARATKGFVVDMSSNRIETATVFASRVINQYDGQLAAAQLDFQTSPAAQQGYVRITTTGLERFGLPDLEASEVSTASAAQMPNIFVAIARQLVRDGATPSIHLTTSALELGANKPEEEGEVDLSLVASTPAVGDRMTSLVRLQPLGGANADGYVEMVEHLFGELEDDHLLEKDLDEVQLEAQKRLPAALAKQRSTSGALLHVMIKFEPGKAEEGDEAEWLWVEVTSWTDREIIGIVVDAPMAGSIGEVQRGTRVRRMRGDVVDFQLTFPNGTAEYPGDDKVAP